MTSDTALRTALKSELNKAFWKRKPSRIMWPVLAYFMLLGNVYLVSEFFDGGMSLTAILVSIIIAGNFGTCFFFILHETMHGAIFKNKGLMWATAYLCGIPCLVTPYLWRQWHNWHHKYTAGPLDTDRMRHPEYDDMNDPIQKLHNKFKRFSIYDPISWGVAVFALPSHHLLMVVEVLSNRSNYSAKKTRVFLETLIFYTLSVIPILFMKIEVVILGLYLPMVISSCICSLYILTNHNNNVLSTKNLTLLNSTSVFLDPIFKSSHFSFGRHVEHHLFPSIAHNKLAVISEYLRKHHPNEYIEMNFFSCIGSVFGRAKDFNQKVEHFEKV